MIFSGRANYKDLLYRKSDFLYAQEINKVTKRPLQTGYNETQNESRGQYHKGKKDVVRVDDF
jgi:hypothetical protein